MILSNLSAAERKKFPLSIVLRLFPDAICLIAHHCQAGADQHLGGELGWDRDKSYDEMDALLRHYVEWLSTPDSDLASLAAAAWRALAMLQKAYEMAETGQCGSEVAEEYLRSLKSHA